MNKDKDIFVSVIIPNYNHARYLDQRLQTVLNQTYQNFEVIILDDKSTDNSLEVIERYKDNPHVSQIIVNEVNSGSPFKQWDKGISLAKGDVIWIAESDDYCELNFLDELVRAMFKKRNVVVASSQFVLFNDESKWMQKERKTRYYNGRSYVVNRLARYNELLNASGIVFSRSAWQGISKAYTDYRSAGDYRFWSEILQYGDVARVGKNLSYFRQNYTSVTGTNGTCGIISEEDKTVVNYIFETFLPNCRQKRIIHWKKARQYQTEYYDNEKIRESILKLWNIKTGEGIGKKYDMLFWILGSIERHLGIIM